MERKSGVEALKNYSFRDVVLKPDDALEVLTQKTLSTVSDNAREIIDRFNSALLQDDEKVIQLKQIRDAPGDFFSPGGLSMSKKNLDLIYQEWGNLTFSKVLQKFINEVFPSFLQEEHPSGNPGRTYVGYLLDIFAIIDPKIASFSDGVQSMIEIMRSGNSTPNSLNPFFLGAIIDDSINLRGIEVGLADVLLADKKAPIELKDTFLRLANEAEKKQFEKGFAISYTELQCLALHIPLN